MFKNLTFVFIIFSLTSCVTDSRTVPENVININLSTKMELPLKDSDFFSWYSTTIDIDSITYLFRENGLYENIQVYDLTKKKLSETISLNKKGSNGIGSLVGFGFYPFTTDSLALVNNLEQMFIMKGDSIIMRYNIEFDDLKASAANSPRNDAKVLKLGDNLYGLPQVKQMDWTKSSFFEQSVFAIYDMDDKEIIDSPVTYPSIYSGKCWTPEMINPTYTHNSRNKKVVFSYPASHNLIEYDYINHTVKEIEIESNIYFEEIESYDVHNCSKERQTQDEYFLNSSHYSFVVYDNHNSVYFHFFALPPPDELEAGYNDVLTHTQVGVVVLDEDYKIINQTLFEPFLFYAKDYFITREGLWLSNNNPENPEFEEDKLKFTLLKLEKNEK